jgi:hypothetical protein
VSAIDKNCSSFHFAEILREQDYIARKVGGRWEAAVPNRQPLKHEALSIDGFSSVLQFQRGTSMDEWRSW